MLNPFTEAARKFNAGLNALQALRIAQVLAGTQHASLTPDGKIPEVPSKEDVELVSLLLAPAPPARSPLDSIGFKDGRYYVKSEGDQSQEADAG